MKWRDTWFLEPLQMSVSNSLGVHVPCSSGEQLVSRSIPEAGKQCSSTNGTPGLSALV